MEVTITMDTSAEAHPHLFAAYILDTLRAKALNSQLHGQQELSGPIYDSHNNHIGGWSFKARPDTTAKEGLS